MSTSPARFVPGRFKPQAQHDPGPRHWPIAWHALHRTDGVNSRMDLGTHTKHDVKLNTLTYTCVCGKTWSRKLGERILETRNWVQQHAQHMADKGVA